MCTSSQEVIRCSLLISYGPGQLITVVKQTDSKLFKQHVHLNESDISDKAPVFER